MTKYNAFGEELRRSGTAVTRFGYQGTAWMRLGADGMLSPTRAYLPETGSFGQRDQLGWESFPPLPGLSPRKLGGWKFCGRSTPGCYDPTGLWIPGSAPGNWLAQQGDTLEALARLVGGTTEDWVCLKPDKPAPSKPYFAGRYPPVGTPHRPVECDEYNATYLQKAVTDHGSTEGMSARATIFKDRYATRFWGTHLEWNGRSAADTLALAAAVEPIKKLRVLGHGDYMGTYYRTSPFLTYTVPTKYSSPTWARATTGLFPYRCWFTSQAQVYAVSCMSDVWAAAFANLLRPSATAYGTDDYIVYIFWWRLRIHSRGSFQASPAAVEGDPHWIPHSGRL